MAVGRVAGDIMRVVDGKVDWRRVERRGVCDVPPERMTYESLEDETERYWWRKYFVDV